MKKGKYTIIDGMTDAEIKFLICKRYYISWFFLVPIVVFSFYRISCIKTAIVMFYALLIMFSVIYFIISLIECIGTNTQELSKATRNSYNLITQAEYDKMLEEKKEYEEWCKAHPTTRTNETGQEAKFMPYLTDATTEAIKNNTNYWTGERIAAEKNAAEYARVSAEYQKAIYDKLNKEGK